MAATTNWIFLNKNLSKKSCQCTLLISCTVLWSKLWHYFTSFSLKKKKKWRHLRENEACTLHSVKIKFFFIGIKNFDNYKAWLMVWLTLLEMTVKPYEYACVFQHAPEALDSFVVKSCFVLLYWYNNYQTSELMKWRHKPRQLKHSLNFSMTLANT